MRYLSLCVAGVSVIGIVSTAGVAKTTASGPLLAAQSETAAAAADVKDAEGKSLGMAELTETPTGVIVTVKLSGIPPGEHALHLHTTGQCQAPDFKSAGGHYNPESKTHGFKSPKGTHKGDLPNVYVDADGTLNVDAFVSGVTLAPGAQSLLDDDGAAIVVHAKLDDYSTDPAGDAGDRIACGVVEKK